MWETINSIFTTLFQVYPIFSIIVGSIILVFVGFMAYMTRVYMVKYKDSNLKNNIMKDYLLAHLTFKEQIYQIDKLSFKVKAIMKKCYHIAFRETTKYQDDLFEMILIMLMNKVRESIVSSLKEPDFFVFDRNSKYEINKYNEKVKDRIRLTKDIVDISFKDSLPNFIEGLNFSRLVTILLSEGIDDIFVVLNQMYSICKDIYDDHYNDPKNIDQRLFDSIKSYN